MHRALIFLLFPAGALAQSPPSLCNADEKVFFSCPTQRGHTLSVCGSPNLSSNNGYLQYRFGSSGQHQELVFPAARESPNRAFQFSFRGMGAKASAMNLSFQISDYKYVVFRYTAVYDTESAGVLVTRPGAKDVRVDCKPNVDSPRPGVPGIRNIDAKHMHELQSVGLPEITAEDLVF